MTDEERRLKDWEARMAARRAEEEAREKEEAEKARRDQFKKAIELARDLARVAKDDGCEI